MNRNSLLDFYREIVNSEKSFGIDYKNLSKQLIERIDKAIEYIKERFEINEYGEYYFTHTFDNSNMKELLEILGEKENEN
jgi:hypothetical protein